MKKILFAVLFFSATATAQSTKKKDTTVVKTDSIDVIVLRFTIEGYNKLVLSIDSLDAPHLKIKSILDNFRYYTKERYPQPSQR